MTVANLQKKVLVHCVHIVDQFTFVHLIYWRGQPRKATAPPLEIRTIVPLLYQGYLNDFVSSTAQSELSERVSILLDKSGESAKCSLEDGSRASPYFQVSSLHRSLQFAFLHRQRTRHITSVGEKSNQDSDKFLQIFLQMFVFPAQGCPLFHANSDKRAPSWCTGAHTTFIIIWSTR